MILSAVQLLTVCPRLKATAGVWTAALNPAMAWAEINNKQRMAAFIAQAAHESNEFTALVENLNYSAEGLLQTFPGRFVPQLAEAYARNPQRIANRVYANRMGNGDEASGDGWRNRGRGPFQLTGHNNYLAYSMARYGDDRILQNPDALIDPKEGAMSACWFWMSKNLNPLADAGQFKTITMRINGAYTGLDSRLAYHAACISVLDN